MGLEKEKAARPADDVFAEVSSPSLPARIVTDTSSLGGGAAMMGSPHASPSNRPVTDRASDGLQQPYLGLVASNPVSDWLPATLHGTRC